jgi:WD40 repeat protein
MLHPSRERLEQLVNGRLGEGERQVIEHHINGCGACAAVVDAIVRDLAQECFAELVHPLEAAPVEVGSLVAGRYQILREVASGGQGVVYEAWQIELRRVVALKMLPAAGSTPVRLALFRAEALAHASLTHPHIVPIYDFGEHGGRPFLVMEFMPGGTMAARIRATERSTADRTEPAGTSRRAEPSPASFAPTVAAETVETLARAIHYAHTRTPPVVHRDLKPGNVLVGSDGALKIADFGLAWELTEGPSEQPRLAPRAGSPQYMAPEQASGEVERIGPRTDVYGLGGILYELLTGRPPYTGGSTEEVRSKLLDARVRPTMPRRLAPGVPRVLQAICLKCLRKDPAERYASAEALAEDLRRFRSHELTAAWPAGRLTRWGRWAVRSALAVKRKPALTAAAILLMTAIGLYVQSVRESRFQAQKAEGEAREAIRKIAEERRAAQHHLATLALERGLQLCEKGDVREGLLWMARAQQAVAEDDDELDRQIRSLLGGWAASGYHLRASLPVPARLQTMTPTPGNHTIVELPGHILGALAPDGRTVFAACADHTVRRWDAATGKLLGPPESYPDPSQLLGGLRNPDVTPRGNCRILELVAMPTGARVVTLQANGILHLREVGVSGPGIQLLHADLPLPVNKTAFSRDGGAVIASNLHHFGAWDIRNGRWLGPVVKVEGDVTAVAVSPDGQHCLIGTREYVNEVHFKSKIRLWDSISGELVAPAREVGYDVRVLAFSPDGKVALSGGHRFGDRGCSVELWDLPVPGQPDSGFVLRDQWDRDDAGSIHSATFSPDGQLVALGSSPGVIQVWEVPAYGPDPFKGQNIPGTGTATTRSRLLGTPLRYEGAIEALTFSGDGRSLLVGGADFLHVLDLPRDRPHDAMPGERGGVMAFRIRNDGLTVLSTSPAAVHTWDLATGREIKHVPLSEGDRFYFNGTPTFSPDGRFVLACTRPRRNRKLDEFDNTSSEVRRWNLSTGQIVGRQLTLPGDVHIQPFESDGKTIVVFDQSEVRLWDVTSGRPVGVPLKFRDDILSATANPNDRTVLIVGHRDAFVWNESTGWTPAPVPARSGRRHAATPDGRFILDEEDVRGGGTRLYIRDRLTGARSELPLISPEGAITSAMSREGSSIVIGQADRTVRRWDVPSMRPLGLARRYQHSISNLAFAPDGQTVIIGTSGGTVDFWPLPAPVLGPKERVTLWTQVITGMELDAAGVARALDPITWQVRRAELGRSGDSVSP